MVPGNRSSFRVDVSAAILDDLRSRLSRTLFTRRSGERPWIAGVDPEYLRELVAYWADGFDWQAREAELNAWPHYRAEIAGRQIHFVHVLGQRSPEVSAPLPLILCHGWPSSFVEMLPLVNRLTDPGSYGGDPAEAFDVVVPSLPGFLFSELPLGPLTRAAIAEILHVLMTGVLGFERYGAFGGDIGGAATQW